MWYYAVLMQAIIEAESSWVKSYQSGANHSKPLTGISPVHHEKAELNECN